MKNREGFSLVELVFAFLIISILAATAIPIMRGRYDAARWAEGKAIMGNIADGLRIHITENGSSFTAVPTLAQLGVESNDMKGTYFSGGESGEGNFSWVINDDYPIDFLVTATAPESITSPSRVTLDHTGTFTETELKHAQKTAAPLVDNHK